MNKMTKLEIIEIVRSTKFTSDDRVTVKIYDKNNNVIYKEDYWGCMVNGKLINEILDDNKEYSINFSCFMNYVYYRTPCRVEIYEQ